jgi:hypothetical protein
MEDRFDSGNIQSQGGNYQIRVRGHVGQEWSDWFDGLTILPDDNGETVLSGPIADQAALHGLLKKVRDLGLPLLSVNCFGTSAADTQLPHA